MLKVLNLFQDIYINLSRQRTCLDSYGSSLGLSLVISRDGGRWRLV